MKEFPCDICGSVDAVEIPVARFYTKDAAPIHVCRNCGFVFVRARRSAQEIADSWSNEIYQHGYTARIPLVKARQTYVADTIDTVLGLKDKKLVDIGGGEGQFLQIAAVPDYGADVFAIEPSAENCKLLQSLGIENYHGTIEDYRASEAFAKRGPADIATIMWTVENCQDPKAMFNAAWDMLAPGGYLAVATGSRLLVPFKKPLHLYISKTPVDTHCFRFSANTLQGLMAVCGFENAYVNRYLDTDWLVVIGRKVDKSTVIDVKKDSADEIIAFFDRWHKETVEHYPAS